MSEHTESNLTVVPDAQAPSGQYPIGRHPVLIA